MNAISKTAALKVAQKAVSAPQGAYTSWALYGPFSADDLSGPSTELHATSYSEALDKRASWVATIAASVLGLPNRDQDVDVAIYMATGSAKERLEAALAQVARA